MRPTILFLSLLHVACSSDSLAPPGGTPTVDMAPATTVDAAQPSRPDAALPQTGCMTVTIGPWVPSGEIPSFRASAIDPMPFPGTTTFVLTPESPQVGMYSQARLSGYRSPAPPEPGYTGIATVYIASNTDGFPHGNMDSAQLADDSGHCLELPESFF